MEHVSVLKKDVQKFLDLKEGNIVVDMTLGLGGHALGILEKIGKKGHLYAFDLDENNIEEAKRRLRDLKKQITFIHDNFRYLKTRVTGLCDAILFDLGLSSPHVDDESRGFSFLREGPLDMRFGKESKLTAYEVVNYYREEYLAEIFRNYGEERYSGKIAAKICERRKSEPFETTTDLADFIKSISPRGRHEKIHPATRIFQALRIEVNDELEALKEGLKAAFEKLKPDGRLVVISYHSLEDRIVKHFFKSLERPEVTDEERIYRNYGDPVAEILTKKPVIPEEAEIEENPRSRSAKLRALKKL